MAVAAETLKTLAQTMAEFTFGLKYKSIPPQVMDAARRHLADTLACALGAGASATVQALTQHAVAQGGRTNATILGTKEK
ncbi:MAG TPA: MmgE/PrpD family protein, partial [Candidatus Limnocylindria bacterium]|nr:MmgE/PrpD family protein [Candidatus Limnocylindria bacterium]